jgi:hypothetical protein
MSKVRDPVAHLLALETVIGPPIGTLWIQHGGVGGCVVRVHGHYQGHIALIETTAIGTRTAAVTDHLSRLKTIVGFICGPGHPKALRLSPGSVFSSGNCSNLFIQLRWICGGMVNDSDSPRSLV